MEPVMYGSASEETSERRRPPPPRAAPWLVIPYTGKGGRSQQAFFNILEPQNRTCRKFIPEMSRKSYWQKPSHGGWLVMLCDDDKAQYPNCKYGDCFLWNPLSLETIQLPTFFYCFDKSERYWIRDCVLSSPPKSTTTNSNDDDEDSMVFFLIEQNFNGIHNHILVYCRPGVDKQWRTKELSGDIIVEQDFVRSILYIKGNLYVMCSNNLNLEIEMQQLRADNNDDENQTISIRSFNASEDTFFPLVGGNSIAETRYLEFRDELFKIVIHYPRRGFRKVVNSIAISRLDFSLMAWKEVKSLGDHVFFLGEKTIATCSAAELGLSKGYLFYTLPEDQSLYVFELEDNCTTVILPCLKLTTPWFSPEWMMMPTPFRVVDGRRRRRIEDVLCNVKKQDNIMVTEESNTSMNDGERDNQGQKHNETVLEEATPWGILTRDIVQLIAGYLHPVDYMHFRAVCKANRSIIPAVYRRSAFTRTIKTTYISPWLVFSKNNDTIYNVIDPMHNNEKFPMNLNELLVGATIRFSKGGWLLMSKGHYTIFFYNPFTKETILLPALWRRPYEFPGISFSSIPTSSDCVVFAIARWIKDEVSICSIARGNNVWRFSTHRNTIFPSYVEFTPCLNNPVFYDGAFYCLDYNGTLGVLNLEDGFTWKILEKPAKHLNDVYPSFLVECDGKLLLVDLGPLGKSLEIFRLDFFKMIWVEVESLGKHMLFISNTSCLSAIAPVTHMENKIYFPRLHGEGILFYSLDTGRYHSLGSQHSAKDFYDTREWLNCTWIEPNWSQATKQELDWLSI